MKGEKASGYGGLTIDRGEVIDEEVVLRRKEVISSWPGEAQFGSKMCL